MAEAQATPPGGTPAGGAPVGGGAARGAWLRRRLRDEVLLRRVALIALLALPPVLLAGRGPADVLLSLVALLFLASRVSAAGAARWSWALRPWHALALLFWAWQLGVSVALGDGHQIGEAVVLIRLFVFLAALDVWVLADARARRWLGWVVLATALWVGIECWQQYLTGTNLFGDRRWGDGSLTGPLYGPRAGPTFLLLAFPAFLPVLAPLLGAGAVVPGEAAAHLPHRLAWLVPRRVAARVPRRAAAARIAGGAGLALMLGTQVLIGQRMPVVLMLFGLAVAALLLPRLRLPALAAVVVGAVLAALTPILSPPTYAKLVVHFSTQMAHFRATQYAQLFERAAAMVEAHPWLGLGFDGFRDHCMDRVYWHDLSWFAVTDPASPLGCSIHPHNYYLQVATGAGLPGLALFVLLGIAWLWRLGRGAGRVPLRAGLFVVAAITLWPIASATSLFTLPNAGWVFLMIGWGLAEARAAAAPRG